MAGRRITILGMGPSSNERKHDIERYCVNTELWGLNNGYLFFPQLDKKWSRFFELHSYDYLKGWKSGAPCHFSALHGLDCDVYATQPLPIIAKQKLVDLAAIADHFDCNYFLGSPSLMLMVALYEHDNGQTIDYIQSYGIDTSDPQHAQQRASWMFWISQAHSRGIKLGGTATDCFAEREIDEGLIGMRENIGEEIVKRRASRARPPVIVAGMLHCGTSMLARCLADAGINMAGNNGTNDNAECIDMMNVIQAEYQRQGFKAREVDNMLAAGEAIPSPTPILAKHLREYTATRRTDEAWGFKHPSASMFAPAFAEVFPEATVILATRNAEDQAASRVRRGMVSHVGAGEAAYHARLKYALQNFANVVIYDYNGNQEEESEKLSKALGVKVDIGARYITKE